MKGIDNKLGKGYSKKFLLVISIKLILIVLFSQSYALLIDKLWQNVLLIIFLTIGTCFYYLLVSAIIEDKSIESIGNQRHDIVDNIKTNTAYKYFVAEGWNLGMYKNFDSLHIIMDEKKDEIINKYQKDDYWSLEDAKMYDEIIDLEKSISTFKFYEDLDNKRWVIKRSIEYGSAYLLSRMLIILIIVLTLSTENNELKLWIWFYDIAVIE